MSKQKRLFYGWINVIACALLLSIGVGLLSNTNSIYIKPVCQDLGFARGDYTLHRTILSLAGVLFMPYYTRLLPKYGAKKILLVCSIMLVLVTFGYSRATRIWHFYVLAAVNGIFSNGISFFLIGTLVNYWFIDSKGLATGLAYCGSNIGGALSITILGNLMDTIGWRNAYLWSAVVAAVVLLPVVLFLVKDRPEQMGLEPYRKAKPQGDAGQAVRPEINGLLLSDAKKTSYFWLMLVSFFFFAFCCGGPSSHTTAFLSDTGYSITLATTMTSCYQISVAVNKIFIGALIDKMGISGAGFLLGGAVIATPLAALFAGTPAAAWMYVIFLGCICAAYSIAISIYTSKLFGNLNFSAILGIFSMDTTLAAALSTPIMGAMFDASGSYHSAWLLVLGFGAMAALGLAIISIKTKKKGTVLY